MLDIILAIAAGVGLIILALIAALIYRALGVLQNVEMHQVGIRGTLDALNMRDANHRPTQFGGPLTIDNVQIIEPTKPDNLKDRPCGTETEHEPHTWQRPGYYNSKKERETVWCRGITKAELSEAARLAERGEEMFNPETSTVHNRVHRLS